jgi:hypothetical protein
MSSGEKNADTQPRGDQSESGEYWEISLKTVNHLIMTKIYAEASIFSF